VCSYYPDIFRVYLSLANATKSGFEAKTLYPTGRVIIGLGFLIFFLPMEIGKNQKTQPEATIE